MVKHLQCVYSCSTRAQKRTLGFLILGMALERRAAWATSTTTSSKLSRITPAQALFNPDMWPHQILHLPLLFCPARWRLVEKSLKLMCKPPLVSGALRHAGFETFSQGSGPQGERLHSPAVCSAGKLGITQCTSQPLHVLGSADTHGLWRHGRSLGGPLP